MNFLLNTLYFLISNDAETVRVQTKNHTTGSNQLTPVSQIGVQRITPPSSWI